ncbi:pentatricopeptide repeat-containing protein At3g02330, mitochondrial [Cryptomeria japonica]|uniref:pentatricopeptide repeat-containing protein At3g02330, mitochondrial n=1 Tax=Cryptomeria japonica TaxID=3369 RepID=UPI0027DA21C3|nr:pentatricopeptide repeat-containing protein At3g02330, mitochondrial [Cryptomeria japonica]
MKIIPFSHLFNAMWSQGTVRTQTKTKFICKAFQVPGYVQHGCGNMAIVHFSQMLEAGARANQFTFASVLTACAIAADLGYGRQVHVHLIMSGFDLNVFVGNALITMYVKCGSIEAARRTFDEIPEPNLISQNAIIAGYVQHGFDWDALTIFSQVQQLGIGADEFTFSSVLAACASLVAVEQGRAIHARMVRSMFKSNVFVGSALVDVYAKCGYIADAYKVFDKMPEKDTVLWNSIIAGYVHNKQGEKAMKQLHRMQREGIQPDRFSLVSILGACICAEYLNYGKQVHAYTIQTRLNSNLSLNNALINMYVWCGRIDNARLVFDKMAEHNIVSWTAIIAGFVHEKHEDEALKIFCKMQQAGMKPNQFTFATILSACGSLATLENGKQVLAQTIKIGFVTNVCVQNSIIAMYAQCGNLEESKKVFRDAPERDVVTWNAIISGCAQHGHGNEALQLFENMQDLGVNPDSRTFVCVLSACRHAGLVKDARHIFDSMICDYGIIPRLEHYACMVDLLGRVGQLHQAMDFIKQMPIEPNASMWQTLIGACKVHGNVELGKYAAERILELEPQAAETYVLLSNIYAAAGRWDDVAYMRNLMSERGVIKDPGCSWIEVQNRVHTFTVGD